MELLLRGEPNGTFLIRLEKNPSLFALHFLLNGQLRNILIDTLWQVTTVGYKIKEQNQDHSKIFPNLQSLIQHYHFCLKVPLKKSMTFERF